MLLRIIILVVLLLIFLSFYKLISWQLKKQLNEAEKIIKECKTEEERQNCLDDNDKPVRKAAKEKRIIEHSLATSELLAHIFISKYMKHTPFYCLEDTYNWQGIRISRQNICNWSLKVHERLKPLEELLPWNIEITPYKIRGEWI